MSKKWTTVFILLLAVVLLAACGPSEPTPPPDVEQPQPEGDTVWDRIQASGKMIVGTAADYEPYEFYISTDETPVVDGFDIALIKEVGTKLGVSVEIVDFAFQGLGGALQIGQVDAAIAAISVTDERREEFDFSNVYFSGVGVALAVDASDLDSIDTPEEMEGKRVGVQETTVYETWAQDELVDTGIIAEDQLFVYAKPEHAVGDLELDRLDIVLMDKLPAEEYVNAGGVKIVGEGVNPQLYAIALPNGATELQAKINEALTELHNEGVVSKLAMEYLGVIPDDSLPPTTPEATSTPGPTPTPSGCLDGMAFVEDLSIADGEKMPPSTPFTKGWLIKNVGTCTWEETYSMKYVYGNNHFGNKEEFVGKKVPPGDLFEMYMNMKSPPNPGEYAGFYQMHNTGGYAFGETVWVAIQVVTSSGATATPAPVPTATPTVEPGQPLPTVAPPTDVPPTEPPSPTQVPPTQAPPPVITSLTASPNPATKGGVITVSWSYEGVDIAKASLVRTDPDGRQTTLGGGDVPPSGVYEDIAAKVGKVTYTLKVDSEFGGSAVQSVSVEVVAAPSASQ